jgi:hypothetical protein
MRFSTWSRSPLFPTFPLLHLNRLFPNRHLAFVHVVQHPQFLGDWQGRELSPHPALTLDDFAK